MTLGQSTMPLVMAAAMLAGAGAKVDGPQSKDQSALRAPTAHEVRPPASAATEAKVPPLAALTQGKTLRVKGLETVPLEITAPPKFKFRMDEGGEDFAPRGHVEGPGQIDIEISLPEGGFLSFSKQRRILEEKDRPTSILRAEETPEGFLMVYRDRDSEGAAEFGAIVSRPHLGVRCDAMFLKHLTDAELAASVCLSLRARARPVANLPAQPPLSPLTDGNLVHIKGLKAGPLDITVPRKLKFRLGHSVSSDGPDANFDSGLELKIVVGPPRHEKFLTLAEQRDLLIKDNPSTSFVRSDQNEAGFLLITQQTTSGFGEGYSVIVSRPALQVECTTPAVQKLAEAETLASACLSLQSPAREAPSKGP